MKESWYPSLGFRFGRTFQATFDILLTAGWLYLTVVYREKNINMATAVSQVDCPNSIVETIRPSSVFVQMPSEEISA